jgi:FkbM family methyltransferase
MRLSRDLLKSLVHTAGTWAGVEISSFQGSFAQQRSRLLRDAGVQSFLDVGAHVGSYAHAVRRQGFAGVIVSCEPSNASLPTLRARAARDERWQVVASAIGATTSSAVLKLSKNEQSSSLLPMLARHLQSAPKSFNIGSQVVSVLTVDDLVDGLSLESPIAVKIDTQGYELEVLRGAKSVLGVIAVVELELSLVPLYEGGPLYDEILEAMWDRGFRLCDVDRAHADAATGELLQFNGLFIPR